MTTTIAELDLRRPSRADARRNYDRLIAAARDGLAQLGPDAPLEEIARRAGVGIATLYRNFPTREALVESVYLEEVEAVCRAAADQSGLPPLEGLKAWLRRLVAYIGTKRALMTVLNQDSKAIGHCRIALREAGEPLLQGAQAAGVVRGDIGIDDVMRLISGISAVGYADEAQRDRVLQIALDGLRASG
jgi:AcrR family transcriptional regulator